MKKEKANRDKWRESSESSSMISAKALGMYDPYGWMARIGLIVPSTNTVIAHEWSLMAPEGVSIHTTRVLLYGVPSRDSNDLMAERTERAAEELATAEVDIIAYGSTSGSFMCSHKDLGRRISEIAGCPATTTSDSVVRALRAIGAKRVAMATPYLEFVNKEAVAFLESEGISVVADKGLGMGETQAERRAINRIPAETVFRLALAVDRPDADALFISCTTLPSLKMIAPIEAELGKPVVTSTQATFWDTLRMLKIRTAISGFGRLLQDY